MLFKAFVFTLLTFVFSHPLMTLSFAEDTILSGEELLDRAYGDRFVGDLTPQIKRRMIRVLVSTNHANFINHSGKLGGFEYELTQRYRSYMKTRVKRRSWPISFVYIPLPFDDLIPALNDGRGDIIAAGMTITEERKKLVDFTTPYIRDIHEILITGPYTDDIASESDLAGRDIYVMKGSSYIDSLNALNQRLEAKGLDLVNIVTAGENLATEDYLEMLQAGIIHLMVADSHVAGLWEEIYPDIVLRDDIILREKGNVAWAVRKGNPEFLENANRFIRGNKQGTLIGNVLFERYYSTHSWISNPLTDPELKKLNDLKELFLKYGDKYGVDWHLVAALAYQESKFNQHLVSPVGAIGVMQVMPTTAAGKAVNIKDITKLENNIHAGVKYIAYVRDNFFNDDAISASDKLNFAIASYNAGPYRVAKLRARAKKHGRNPNVWFEHVEIEARRVIGFETVDYVGKVNKYFIAYTLMLNQLEKRMAEKEKLEESH